VAESRPPPVPATESVARSISETRIAVETVVLPRERSKVDARPDELRRRTAIARYRGDPPTVPAPSARRRYA